MKIKINKIPKDIGAIPTARVAVSYGETDLGAAQITTFISAENAHGIPSVVASLRMSVAEARDFAARIVAECDKEKPAVG